MHPPGHHPRSARFRRVVALTVSLLAAAVLTAPSCGPPRNPKSKPVFAEYHLWWSDGHWRNKLGPSYPFTARPYPLPAVYGADGCAVRSLFPGNQVTDVSDQLAYDQDKPGVIERDVRAAALAGITGFSVDWRGTGSPTQTPASLNYSRRLEEMFRAVHRVNADGLRFKIQLNLKTASHPTVSRIKGDLTYFLNRYGSDPALDHTLSAKPEVIWTRSWDYTDAEIAEVSRAFRNRIYLIADHKNQWGPAARQSFDANSWYWSSQDPYDNPASFSQVKAVGDRVHADGKKWLAPLTPGFDAKLLNGGSCVPRNGGGTLRRVYNGNKASNPDAWLLISWNEIAEGTYMLPLTRYGAGPLATLRTLIERGG